MVLLAAALSSLVEVSLVLCCTGSQRIQVDIDTRIQAKRMSREHMCLGSNTDPVCTDLKQLASSWLAVSSSSWLAVSSSSLLLLLHSDTCHSIWGKPPYPVGRCKDPEVHYMKVQSRDQSTRELIGHKVHKFLHKVTRQALPRKCLGRVVDKLPLLPHCLHKHSHHTWRDRAQEQGRRLSCICQGCSGILACLDIGGTGS